MTKNICIYIQRKKQDEYMKYLVLNLQEKKFQKLTVTTNK